MYNGFHSYETTPDMVNVGCEVCHGPGIDHVNYVSGEEMREKPLPPDRSYTIEASQDRCVACHDRDRDATFNYSRNVPLVDHSQVVR